MLNPVPSHAVFYIYKTYGWWMPGADKSEELSIPSDTDASFDLPAGAFSFFDYIAPIEQPKQH
ncbi:MAG: hypothetical protein RIG77_02160 [Cyclobacteriaceae bacterium]